MAGQSNLLTRLGGLAVSVGVRGWMGSMSYCGAYYDPTVDPARNDFRGPIVAVAWHEYLLTPFYLRGHTDSALLTSRHRDAEWLAQAAGHMGFRTIRGSTARGGTRALLECMRQHRTRNLGIAGDGPRGPRRQLAPGPIYLSSRLQMPLVLYGIGYSRCWRTPTWDRFGIPFPGSRVRLIMSPRLQIPAKVNRQQLENYRQQVESMLLRLTWEAEAWAEAGDRKRGQVPLYRTHQSDTPVYINHGWT